MANSKNLGPFSTAQEANTNKPSGKQQLFSVVVDGDTHFAWAGNYDGAIGLVARSIGWKCTAATKAPSTDKVQAILDTLPAAEREKLLALYVS